MSRPQSARHGARAAGSSVAPHPRESERRRTSAARETRRWLGVGGRSWHVTPQSRTIRESLLPAQCACASCRPPTTSAAWRARAASSSSAPHPSDSERRRTSSARETRRCLGVGGRSLHVAPRARDERERPLVGAGGYRRTHADHDQSGTARARSKLGRRPSSLVTASAGAPAPCGTWRWLNATRWKPRLARRRTGANRMTVASHWRGAVRQLMSRPQPARQGARVAGSSVAPHPSESDRRRTSAARETRRCLGVGGAAAGTSHHEGTPKERGL